MGVRIRWWVVAFIATLGCGDDDGVTDGGVDASMARSDGGSGRDLGGEADGGCEHTGDPLLDPTLLEACPLCENARCISAALLPADTVDQLADCDADRKCVPDLFIETNGNFRLESCRSLGDLEGRCLSECLPAVSEQLDLLPASTCASGERCVPCFDPISAEPTGACGLSCDPGPTEPPPEPSAACCFELGSCVTAETIPEGDRDLLGMDTCDEGALCLPNAFTDSSFIPASCRSISDAEGRCLPVCLPAVAAQADTLPQDSCDPNHLCVPCTAPTTGESTGACTFNGDMPTEDPVVFAGCCAFEGSDRGRCVPESSIPADGRDSLPQDSCEAMELCVPDLLLADPEAAFPSCTTGGIGPIGGDPGACLPDCLVDGFTGFILQQSTCADGELCAPCQSPLDGSDTGACR